MEYVHILNDDCINKLYIMAENYFQNTEIKPIRDSRGIILRFWFDDFDENFAHISQQMYKNIVQIEYFLAKIENPAIIEVHTDKISNILPKNLKKWEMSTVIANNIEAVITEPAGIVSQDRINSVGYGEFLPAKNPPNNGGNYPNRVDIIVLCSISGE